MDLGRLVFGFWSSSGVPHQYFASSSRGSHAVRIWQTITMRWLELAPGQRAIGVEALLIQAFEPK
jgi:hypothetical protein